MKLLIIIFMVVAIVFALSTMAYVIYDLILEEKNKKTAEEESMTPENEEGSEGTEEAVTETEKEAE